MDPQKNSDALNDVEANDDAVAYLDQRNTFNEIVESRKQPVFKSPSSEVHLERTEYFEQSSGYKYEGKS